jgi:hypothetical protein
MRNRLLDCDITTEDGFMGKTESQEYWERLSNAVFGLNPNGNNPETHRLAEIMDQGTIPAMLYSPYLDATFARIPGVIENNWDQVADKMLAMYHGPRRELDLLQDKVVLWYERYKQCVRDDIHQILRLAMSSTPLSNE